jgi:hypothetical protein
MTLAEFYITLEDQRRRLSLALIQFRFYIKRNAFGFTFMIIQILFVLGYSLTSQHENWTANKNDEYKKQTSPETSITSEIHPSNGLQALFLSLLGQGLMYSYLRKYGYSAVGFSFLIGIVILEWGVLLRYFFEVSPFPPTSPNPSHLITSSCDGHISTSCA